MCSCNDYADYNARRPIVGNAFSRNFLPLRSRHLFASLQISRSVDLLARTVEYDLGPSDRSPLRRRLLPRYPGTTAAIAAYPQARGFHRLLRRYAVGQALPLVAG